MINVEVKQVEYDRKYDLSNYRRTLGCKLGYDLGYGHNTMQWIAKSPEHEQQVITALALRGIKATVV